MSAKPWLKNYAPGVPHTLEPYPTQDPIFKKLEEAARKHPDAPCTIFKGATITYKQMNDMTDQLAAGLASLGVKKGDRVGIMMPNIPQFVLAFYAILKAGGVVVAMNPTYPADELVTPLNDAEIGVVLVMSKFYDTINKARGKTKLKKVIVTNVKEALPPLLGLLFSIAKEKKEGHHVELREGDVFMKDLLAKFKPSDRPNVTVTGEDRALFQYSGGTTGTPKAAVALHRNIVANSMQLHAWLVGMKEAGEVMMMAIPLFHVYGMIAGMSFSVATANPMVMIPDARDLKDLFANINKYKPTLFPAVPRLYNAINNHPDVAAGKVNLKSIKACISGSAPLLLDTKTKFESLSGGTVFEGFGMSEVPTASHCNPFMGKNKEGSIGMPLPDMEVKLVDLDDGKTEMAMGEVGELIVRGPQVMWGYHNMPTETQNSLRDLGDGGKPWLFTGDIARMDEDGYFYIVDRKKELIKIGGFQVWPRDIEEALAANPKVLEAAAAGVPHPEHGEAAKAWVVLKPGESATEAELKSWCTDKLAKYKVPYQIEFRPELPKTAVFKVLRRELVRQHKEAAKK
ncbi:MAG: long-chain fatty acid--CoA ligase [Chloroflexi bacterium]|nr:long-chain fatty acid--CoA ligase [Chloroflexota bacterium]